MTSPLEIKKAALFKQLLKLKSFNVLHHFLSNKFGVGAADREALSIQHFYYHTSVEVLLDLFEIIDIYDRASVNAYKYFGIQNLFQLSNTRRTNELVILSGKDRVVTRGFQIHDFIHWQVQQFLGLLYEDVRIIGSFVFGLQVTQQLSHVILFYLHAIDCTFYTKLESFLIQWF